MAHNYSMTEYVASNMMKVTSDTTTWQQWVVCSQCGTSFLQGNIHYCPGTTTPIKSPPSSAPPALYPPTHSPADQSIVIQLTQVITQLAAITQRLGKIEKILDEEL